MANRSFPCSFLKRCDNVTNKLPLLTQLDHKCFNQTLDRFANTDNSNREIQENGTKMNHAFTKALAALTGSQCLPVRTAVSPLMKNLIQSAIKIGQQ